MKKLCSLLLTVTLFLSLSIPTFAAPAEALLSTTVEDLRNGYFAVITMETQEPPRNSVLRASKTFVASKTYTIKNNAGDIMATYKLNGRFSVDVGRSATCTSVSHTTSTPGSSWTFSNASSTRSGNVAFGSFTAKLIVLGITWNTVSDTISIKCDNYGNMS